MYIQFPRKKKRKKKAHRVNRYFGYIMSSTYADHLSCFRWSAFFYFFWFGIFSFLLDEPVTLPSCFFVFFFVTGGTSLVVCIIILHTLLDSIYTLYTVFNDSRERVRSIIKLSMINKLVDANGWWGEYNASWLLWMGKSIGSRHLFNNGRAAHDETERWMDISGTTTSLKKN